MKRTRVEITVEHYVHKDGRPVFAIRHAGGTDHVLSYDHVELGSKVRDIAMFLLSVKHQEQLGRRHAS